MPIYEYECADCGHLEEALQKFSDKPLSTCNRCSGALHKVISQSTFHLKGSGWYVTDYANKSKNSASSSKQKADKSTSDAKATASDSKKPEKKTKKSTRKSE